MGGGEGISCFALLTSTAFALIIKLSLSQPMSFLAFMLPFLQERVSEWLCEVEMPAGVKTQDLSKENVSHLPPAKKNMAEF